MKMFQLTTKFEDSLVLTARFLFYYFKFYRFSIMQSVTWDPTSGSICVQFKWHFNPAVNELVLSDFINIPGMADRAFRVGASTDYKRRLNSVICYVNSSELSCMGVMVKAVSCSLLNLHEPYDLGRFGIVELDLINRDPNYAIFRFSQLGNGLKTFGKYFIFSLRLTGTSEHFCPYRFDSLIGQHLWTAAVNKQMTDVVFEVGDSTFPAHKFLLAARSRVFAAMFQANMIESLTGRVKIVDFDAETFEEFLRFVYTGQLVKPTSAELGLLAEKYEVKTLFHLCWIANNSENEIRTHKVLLTIAKWKPSNIRYRWTTLRRYKTVYFLFYYHFDF